MAKPKMGSGHGDCNKRVLTERQRATLRKAKKVVITVRGMPKTVRRANVRNGCIEWYERSDRHGEPALRNYDRDWKSENTKYRPSAARRRNFEGDFGSRA